jgi:hypothetical protein
MTAGQQLRTDPPLSTSRTRNCLAAAAVLVLLVAAVTLDSPAAHADNKRLNDGVVANVYTIQHHAGCATNLHINPQLRLAAQWHTDDVLNNRDLNGDIGSDGTTQQDRANAAGFRSAVAETVAINPRAGDHRHRTDQPVVLQPRLSGDHDRTAPTPKSVCGPRTVWIAASSSPFTDSPAERVAGA